VTHVIRAEEWLSSMPKHIALYRAFGWNLPEFCHMPLLRNRDKTKISKRKNPVSLTFYRNIGILPEALLNFLGLMGFSLPDDKEVFSVDEMVEHFSFDKIKLGGPVFDFDKLLWLNGIYIRKLEDKELTQRLIKEIFSPQRIDPIIPLLKERIKVLGEFPKAADFFFNHRVLPDRDDLQKALKGMDAGKVRTLLKKYVEQANEITIWKKDEIEKHLKNFCEKEQVSSSEFFMLLRILVTGGKASPPLIESIEVIGRTALTRRVLEGIILIGAGGV
jgi:glutamyl-tRNA synthetase